MPDNRFKDFPTDYRFPGGGVDARFATPGLDLEQLLDGTDTRFEGASYAGGAPPAPFTARFGVGADNATGTGAFDTSLYTGSTPANGTYGNFSVTSGIITPNGSQTAGTYDVGGWPVEVISGYKAVKTQGEFDALTPANSSGKTILIREAAGLSAGVGWNNSGDFNWATILGDGTSYRSSYLDASKDARKHFVNWFVRNTKRLILDGLNVVTGSAVGTKVPGIIFEENGGTVRDIQVLRCRVIGSRPGAFDDFSGGAASFPGADGITFTGTLIDRVSVRDNVVYGTYGDPASINLGGVRGWAECVGNHVDMVFGDAYRMPNIGAGRSLFSACYASRPLSLASDAGNPHGDGVQYNGSAEGIAEAIGMVQGDTRGNWQNFFATGGTEMRLVVRDCVISDESLYSYTIMAGQGSTIENVVWLPMPGTTLPIAGVAGGMRYHHTSGLNELKNSVHRAGFSDVQGGITQTGVVDSTSWTSTDYGTNFPNWDYGTTVPTLENLLGTIGLGASAASGKTPRILSTGAERSDIALNLTAPTLSSLSLTPASDGFTGTVTSDQTRSPIYWCVVTNGSPAPTWRQIKERRATGGLVYGDGWVTGATLALSTTALSPSTTYTVYAVQELGWSKQSNILSANVTTTAVSGITFIGSGADATVFGSPLVMPIPAGANGEYLVACVMYITDLSDPTTPSGWTRIGTGVGTTTGTAEIAVFGRVRDGSEGANLSVVHAGLKDNLGFVLAYDGVSGDGAEATANGGGTSMATPTLSATANSCILHIWAGEGGTGNVITLPNAGDLANEMYVATSRYYIGVEHQLSVSAGTTTARTATINQSMNWNTMQVELLA